VVRHGEAASSNKDAAEKFVEKFKDLVDREEFIPEPVFSCDETGLFWKECQNGPISQEKRRPLVLLYHVYITSIYK